MEVSEEADFKKLLKEFSKGTDFKKVSDEKLGTFFELWERTYSLPSNSNDTVIDQFIKSITNWVWELEKTEKASQALNIFLNFLKVEDR